MLMLPLCHDITYTPQISHDGLCDMVVWIKYSRRSIRDHLVIILMATSKAGLLET